MRYFHQVEARRERIFDSCHKQLLDPLQRVKRLYIGKLPRGLAPEAVRAHFETFGELEELLFPCNEKKKRLEGNDVPVEVYRGFAFVTFRNPEDAEKALRASHIFDAEEAFVTPALPKVKGQKYLRIGE